LISPRTGHLCFLSSRRDIGFAGQTNLLSRWHTLPPEAAFHELNSYKKCNYSAPQKASGGKDGEAT